jgi:hypothetical protein
MSAMVVYRSERNSPSPCWESLKPFVDDGKLKPVRVRSLTVTGPKNRSTTWFVADFVE